MTGLVMDVVAHQASGVVKRTVMSEDEVPVSTFMGKKYSHWSMGVALAGTVVGAVVAIAGYLFGHTVGCVAGAALFVTNMIAYYFLKQFVPMASLEGYVKQLTARIEVLKEQNGEFKKINQDFGTLNTAFDAEIEKAKKQAAEHHAQLAAEANRLEGLTKQLTETQAKLETVQALYDQLKSTTQDITEQVAKFNHDNEAFKANVDTLKDQTMRVVDLHDRIKGEVKALGQHREGMAQKNQEVAALSGQLREQIALMQTLYENTKAERLALQQKVDQLQKIVENTNKNVAQIDAMSKQVATLTAGLNQNTEDLKALAELAELAPGFSDLLADFNTNKK